MNHRFINFTFIVFFVGCAHSEAPVTSEWAEIKNVPSVSCQDWPTKKTDLSVDNIYVSAEQNAKFLVSQHRSRKNVRSYYLVSVNEKTNFGVDDLKPLNISNEESISGLAQFGKIGALVIERNESEALIRNVETKKMIAQVKVPGEAYNMTLHGNKLGFWLQHQKPDDDHYYLQKLDLKKSNTIGPVLKINSRPRVIELGTGAFAVSSQKSSLSLQSLATGKTVPFLKIGENIESWDLINSGNTLLVALVDGDSQVEGVSNLHIYSFTFSPKKISQNWKKVIVMKDRHVSAPIWRGGKNPELNISHWIDGEALLTRYLIDPKKGVLKTDDAGVLQNNQYIIGFTAGKPGESGQFITRKKGKNFWRFQVCKL